MALLVNPTHRIISIRINLGYRAASTSNRLITGVRKHLTIISITLPRLPSYWHPRNFISLFPRRGNRKKKTRQNQRISVIRGFSSFAFLVFSFRVTYPLSFVVAPLQIVTIDRRTRGKNTPIYDVYVFRSLFVDDSPPFWILSQWPLKYRSILIDSPSRGDATRMYFTIVIVITRFLVRSLWKHVFMYVGRKY